LNRDRGCKQLFTYLSHAVDLFYWIPATFGLIKVHPAFISRMVSFHPMFNIARILPFHTERVIFAMSYLYLLSVALLIYKSSGSVKKFAKNYKLAIKVMSVVSLLRFTVTGRYGSVADLFYALAVWSLFLVDIGTHLYNHF
jgi:hypothetical protein